MHDEALCCKEPRNVSIFAHSGLLSPALLIDRLALLLVDFRRVNSNFDQNVLTIPRSKHGEKRHVFLNDSAIAALRVLWRFSKCEGRVFANGYTSEKTKGAREWFQNCLVDAGIKNFTWHSLRHTFGSRLLMAGVDIRTVQELMGHRTITMTLRYSHLAPQHQLAAVQKLCDAAATQKGETDGRTDSGVHQGLAQKQPVFN